MRPFTATDCLNVEQENSRTDTNMDLPVIEGRKAFVNLGVQFPGLRAFGLSILVNRARPLPSVDRKTQDPV